MAQVNIGDVTGGSQVAVGDYIVQIGRVEGGIVNILNNAPPPPRVRPQPVQLRPKVFPGLLDRQTETATLIDALKSQRSVECTGTPGAGRTSLLRHLAYQSQIATLFPAGVVYFQVNQQSAPDLLKSVFDAFYTCDFPIKPNETEIRHFLQSINALVLLDDVEVDAQQVEHLMNVAPSCTFVVVTRARELSTDVAEVEVKGLPAPDAIRLFQSELGRTILNEEENSIRAACEAVGCIPLLVVRKAHEARDQQPAPSADEKKVLAALAVFSGTSVAGEHVAAIAGLQDAQPVLENLEQRGLVQSHEQNYTLAPDVTPEQPADQQLLLKRALNYFVGWTEQHRGDHKRVAAAGGAILLLLKQAVDAKAWTEVSRIGHASEEALTVTGKWDMWANVLDSIELSANAQGDVAERAWVLHQLGTRALCLGDRYAAESALRDALSLRERIHDLAGAEATRHNLNILLGIVPPKPERDHPNDNPVKEPTPLWLKAGVVALVGLAALTVFFVWRYLSTQTANTQARIASFSINPTTIPANGQAQLCYEVEHAQRILIEPDVGERKGATKECVNVTPSQTLTYTLTAFAANGKTTTQQATLIVEPPPTPPQVRQADIAYFAVEHHDGPGGDPQLSLCYEVHDANHAEIDNEIGEAKLNRRECRPINPQQTTTYTISATGADGTTKTRQATADATKPPVPLPQILSFTASPEQVVDDGTSSLCFKLKDATTAQLDPGARPLRVGPDAPCVSVKPLKRTTYTLRAFNSEGKEAHEDKIINVLRSPKVTEFKVRPNRIKTGEPVTLCFKVENASRIDIEPGIAKNRPVDSFGPCVQQRPRSTTTYTIIAFNDSGLKSQPGQDTVTVEEPQPLKHARILFFQPTPQKIKRGERVRLCYGVTDANTTSISPAPGEVPSAEKNCVDQAPRQSTTYTLKTTGEDNKPETLSESVTVEEPEVEQPHVRITHFAVKRRAFGGPQLCYTLENARSARIDPVVGALDNLTSDCRNIPPRDQQTYTLTAVGPDQKSESKTVPYTPPEPPKEIPIGIISFTGPKQPIKPRSEAKLCYSTLGEGTAAISPEPGKVQPSIRNCVTVFPERTTEYTLTVTSPQGEKKSQKLTVNVVGPVIQ